MTPTKPSGANLHEKALIKALVTDGMDIECARRYAELSHRLTVGYRSEPLGLLTDDLIPHKKVAMQLRVPSVLRDREPEWQQDFLTKKLELALGCVMPVGPVDSEGIARVELEGSCSKPELKAINAYRFKVENAEYHLKQERAQQER